MKNRLFYFAACVALALSSVSCSSDDGEDEDVDIPVVGKIAVSGAYNVDRKSTRLNSSHIEESRMPSSA